MKRLLPLLIIGILVLSGLGAVTGTEDEKKEIISETIKFSQPIVHENADYISIELSEATSKSWEEDKPTLPVVSMVYTFPFGTHIDNLEVTFSDIIEQEISKPVKPSPELQILSTMHVSNNVKKPEKIMTYSDIDIYPEQRFGYRIGAGLKDEEHVIYLTVTLYPVQYKPKENTIYYSKSAIIYVTFTPPEKPVVFPDEYDLLIITPAEFESALQPLVDHKNNLNSPMKTIMASLDDIPSQGGIDEQEDIKYYIRDAIENWGITYVILVGAGVEEGEELFPVRYAWIDSNPYEDYFPSDLYYADIYNGTGGFSNWDYDGDGKHAEYRKDLPNMDVLPDVYLGKLPCNNVEEVNTVVEKIINYKAHNKMTKKILQLGGDSLPGTSVYEGEYANGKVMDKLPGYTPTQLWATNGKLTKENIATGFKSSVDFVDLSGHGNPSSWSTHPPDNDSVWIPPKTLISPYNGFLYIDYDLYMINNAKKLPVVVFTACSNNKYTQTDMCIGWKTVCKKNGGGIASFAESGIGHGPGGPNFIEHCIGWMEVKVFDELYKTKVLGQVWGNCISGYYNNFELDLGKSDYKTMLEFSMFGDPTLAIEDGDDPENIPVYKPISNGFLQRLIDYFPQLARLFEQIMTKR